MGKLSVIGGSGFLGQSFLDIYSKKNKDFEILDINEPENFKSKFKRFNVSKKEEPSKLSGDIILNLAAEHRDDVKPIQKYYEVNVEGAKNLCSIANKNNIKTIIFTSSVAVYGFAEKNSDESAPLNPFNHYGRSKAQAEKIYLDWFNEDPTSRRLIIIRPTAIFGKNNRGNIYNLFMQSAVIATLAVGITIVLLLGEIDLSAAATAGVCAALLGVLVLTGIPSILACLIVILVGIAMGLVQGLLVAYVGIPSFVVTLAGLLGYQGLMQKILPTGNLNVGDPFICNNISGKVRAMMNERGQRIKTALPSDPVQVLGFDHVPQSSDIFAVVEDEKEIKRITSERQRLKREIDQKKISTQSLDSMSALIKEGSIKNLPIIIKGDVDGSIEALSEQLTKISNDEVGVQVIHKSVGMVSESDVLLAAASNAVIVGFHVQISSNAKLQAQQEGVDIRTYNVIYQAVEEVTLALEGLLEPEEIEETLGKAVVQESFKIPKIGFIAGSKVLEGNIVRNGKARVIRDDEEIANGEITSLKHLKDDVKEIKEGFECGIGINDFSKFKEGDFIICYEIKSLKRKFKLN